MLICRYKPIYTAVIITLKKYTVNSICWCHMCHMYLFLIHVYAMSICIIEGKAMIRNRYNYPTPPIRDIKETETQDPNGNITSRKPNGQLLSHKVAKWLSKTKRCKRYKDIQRQTITKINHDRRNALERSVKRISLVGGGGLGLKSILRGHNPRPYFCRGLDT